MSFKCPDCGASLTDDSRFCRYCGAKIDDGVKRVEVKIDKRIEDVAEVKRATLEEKEFERKVAKEKRANIAKWIKRGVLLALLILGVVLISLPNTEKGLSSTAVTGAMIIIFELAYIIISWLHKMGA